MWASGQRVVEGVEEEGVMTVGTSYPAHTRHIGQRRGHRGRGRQVDDPLAVWPKVRQFGNFLFLLQDSCDSCYLGQAILWLLLLQMSRQLQGHRTYFLPGGAFLMGVASLHWGHLTTCCKHNHHYHYHEASV